jgi:protein TonB
MLNNPTIRLLIGIVIALPVVIIIFLIMNLLISVEEINVPEGETRTLSAITPQQQDSEARARSRTAPKRLESAQRPPPPPRASATRSDINLPTPRIDGAVPQNLDLGRMQALAIDPVAVSDRDAQPIRPPTPSFPQRAAERGLSGSCEVRFDVDTRGRPYNVQATCTDNIFKSEAERSVSRVEFAPKIVRGQAVERRNVVYPLEFKLQ